MSNSNEHIISQTSNQVPFDKRVIWLLFIVGMGNYIFTLTIPHVGEEGFYTVSSLEMWLRKEWIFPILYGEWTLPRPPLYNWLIISLANLLGWDQMLIASRLVTATATTGTGLMLWYLIRSLTGNAHFAIFCSLCYLSGDILVERGWLAYADPLFSFFVFSAITFLVIATHREQIRYLPVAIVAVFCGFLTKALTAYVFYGLAVLVLLTFSEYRRFLLQKKIILIHVLTLLLPLFWYLEISAGVHGPGMINDILLKLVPQGISKYLIRLIAYPTETFIIFAPLSFVAVYLFVRKPAQKTDLPNRPLQALIGILVINYLPYWLAPQGGMRYLMPIYPLIGVLLAWTIWRSGFLGIRLAVRWMALFIVLCYVYTIWGLPYSQRHFKGGDFQAVANKIQTIVEDKPLFTNNDTATGLSVTASINLMRLPGKPLVRPPATWNNGFVIHYIQDPNMGRLVEEFIFPRSSLFLLCKGTACESNTINQSLKLEKPSDNGF